MEGTEISSAVITRLPRYYRYLGNLLDEGVERISSRKLSEIMNVTASQIRQDLNNFGGFGMQGYGYNVEKLYNEIGKILGVNGQKNVIIIGAGHLGRALANYSTYRSYGFKLKALFDINTDLAGYEIGGARIYSMNFLEDFLKDNEIDIAALCVPRTQSPVIAEKLVANGINALWNFSHTDLKVPDDVAVENVHLIESLMKLSYRAKCLRKNSEDQ